MKYRLVVFDWDGTVTEVVEGLKEGDAVVVDSINSAKPLPTGAPPASPATRRMF